MVDSAVVMLIDEVMTIAILVGICIVAHATRSVIRNRVKT